ncbi:MAG: hypothetical protein K6L73_12330 [Cellvibrionaceae bacterium]
MGAQMLSTNTSQLDQMLATSVANVHAGNCQEVEKLCRSILGMNPAHAMANYGMGRIAVVLNKVELAPTFFQIAVDNDKQNPDYWVALIESLVTANKSSDAKKAVKKAKKSGVDAKLVEPLLKAAKKTHANEVKKSEIPANEILNLKGFLAEKRYTDGINHARTLEKSYPTSGTLQKFLGYYHIQKHDLKRALEYNRKANQLLPDDYEILNNIAISLNFLRKFDEAEKYCRKSLALNPDYEAAAATFCSILSNNDNYNAAVLEMEQFSKQFPKSAYIQFNNASYLAYNGRYLEAAEKYEYIYRELLGVNTKEENLSLTNELNPLGLYSTYLFCLSSAGHPDKSLYISKAKKYNQVTDKHFKVSFPLKNESIEKTPNGKIKIGFMSGDYKSHPVAYFSYPIIEKLNKDLFEVTLYSTGEKHDKTTEEFKALDINWQDIGKLSTKAAYQKIVSDGMNILIDLSGHTSSNYLPIISKRAAPMQATWIGMGDSTGINNCDYLICDPIVVQSDESEFYTEKPLHLDANYLCYTPKHTEVEIKDIPAIKNGYITFGCFNHWRKVSDLALKCWGEILANIPNSKLLIKHKQLELEAEKKKAISHFEEMGISADRIMFKGHAKSIEDHLNCFNDVDISLDPFPYTGATTTCESLFMATPVVTLHGDRFLARFSSTFLQNCGLNDWVSYTEEDYVKLAIEKAADIESLSNLHKGLREQFMKSDVCNADKLTKNLEKLLIDEFNKITKNYN